MDAVGVSDLRIGNLIYVFQKKTSDDKIETVYKIEEDSVNGYIFYLPIPLTEEWLVRADFEFFKKNKGCCVVCKKSIQIKNFKRSLVLSNCFGDENPEWSVTISDDDMNHIIVFDGLDLKYVHTLQNLWLTLTKKELIHK